MMKRVFILLFVFLPFLTDAQNRDYYVLQLYHYKTAEQEKILDEYFSKAYLPALNRQNIKMIGVFGAIENDTASYKRLYVLITIPKLEAIDRIHSLLNKDLKYQQAGAAFINTAPKKPAYTRYEQIVLKAFDKAPMLKKPRLKSGVSEKIYELRSYESSSDKLFRNKVNMFNEGDEIGIFSKLGFNAIFYGEVLAGAQMPNLMYLTSFENMTDRNAHWKTFGVDPDWKKLSTLPEYQNNVSHIDIQFLKARPYSQL